MRLLLALFVLTLPAALLRNREKLLATFLVATMLAIPSFASESVTGIPYVGGHGGLALQAVTFAALLTLAVQVVDSPQRIRLTFERLAVPLSMLVLTLLSAFLQTVMKRGSSGLSQLVDGFLGPLVFFFVMTGAGLARAGFGSWLRLLLVMVGMVEATLGLAQYLLKMPILWPSEYLQQAWYGGFLETGFRSFGTLYHPLNLAAFLLLCIPAALSFERTPHQVGATAVLIVGILSTGSRAAIVIVLVIMIVFETIGSVLGDCFLR